jgi:hypothetical protein
MLSFEGDPPVGSAEDWVSVELRVVLIGSIQASVIESAGSLPPKTLWGQRFQIRKN